MAPESLLEVAARHVSKGENLVARQRMLIHHLMLLGSDTADAEQLLETFNGCLAIFRKHHAAIVRGQ